MPKSSFEDALDQIDHASDRRFKEIKENQEILHWAYARARADPQYVKHICDRYHERINREKLARANAVCKAR